LKKVVFFFWILFVFISCDSRQKKADLLTANHQQKESEKQQNYIGIKANKKDTIFTNTPFPLDTAVYEPNDKEKDWKDNLKVATINTNLPGNVYKLQLLGKRIFNIDSGFYATEKLDIPEKPIQVIDSGKITIVIEPEQKKLLAPNFKDNAQYNIWCLGPDQGLASRNIYSILKDDNGFMWFGTDNGLIRYDGTNAKTYNIQSGLPENEIRVVRKDKKGNLWLGTEESGLVKFDGKTFHHYSLDSIAPKRAISDIEIDEKGDVWCTIIFGGLLHFDGKTFHSYKSKQGIMVNRPTSSIAIDKSGRKWITGYGQGLYTMTDNGLLCLNGRRANNVGASYIHSSFIDNTGKLYLGIFGVDYCVVDKDTVRTYLIPHNKSDGFVSITQDKQGNVWAAADVGGIYKLGDTNATHIGEEHGISSDIIYTMYTDDLGKIWIGTEGGGVCCFNPESNRALNASRGSQINYYCKVAELKNGGYIMVTDNGVNYYKDSILMQLTDLEKNGNKVQGLTKGGFDLAVDENEFIHTALLNSGAYVFRREGNDFRGIRKWGIHINETSIEILKNNEKWIAGMDGHGIYQLTATKKFNFTPNQNFFLQNVISLLADSKGAIWAGSERQGVCRIKDNKVTYFNKSNGLPDNTITNIYEDKDNRIWVATEKGLSYFENNAFVKVEFNNEEISENIKAIIHDEEKRYWITTDNGILVLIPKAKEQKAWSISNYVINTLGKQDGLLNASFTRGSILINSKNELVVGSEGNLMFLSLNNFKINTTKPSAILETVKINGSAINYRNKDELLESQNVSVAFDSVKGYFNLPTNLILPSHSNHLTFEYSGIYWQNPLKLKYLYFLEGLETEWNKSGSENIAEYRNLSYGKYKFHLKAYVVNGSESEELVYSFEIERPWWHTWWARATYVLMILLSVGLFIRWRTFHLKARQKELESEVANATTEIRDQKDRIEEAHKNIKDSITYAKRIQSAILPSARIVKEYLPKSFILYNPKDIVAGDFYWMEQKDEFILFAAADCTGHGVPGAMVSVVCNNGLNRSVREFGLSDPGKILDKTREIVISEFEKSDEDVKDGMDISLCALNLKTRTLYWSGANNPIWIIRKGANVIDEIKGNKQPVGKFADNTPFQTHKMEMNEGDTFYIFTDGYQDQFGGERGKKFKAAQMKELLLSLANESMEKQCETIQNAFEVWKGKLEQVDDMCFIGVRL